MQSVKGRDLFNCGILPGMLGVLKPTGTEDECSVVIYVVEMNV